MASYGGGRQDGQEEEEIHPQQDCTARSFEINGTGQFQTWPFYSKGAQSRRTSFGCDSASVVWGLETFTGTPKGGGDQLPRAPHPEVSSDACLRPREAVLPSLTRLARYFRFSPEAEVLGGGVNFFVP